MLTLVIQLLAFALPTMSGQSNYEITQSFYHDRTVDDLPWNAQAPNMTDPDDPFAQTPLIPLTSYTQAITNGPGVKYKKCTDPPVRRSDIVGINFCSNEPYAKGCESTATAPYYKCVCDEGKACKFCNITATPCSPLSQFCNPDNTKVCTPSTLPDRTPSCDIPVCTCKPGYETNWDSVKFGGKQCESEINECAKNPCLHNGQCHNEPGSFYCDCPSGYTGQTCDIKTGCDQGVPCANAAFCKQFNDGTYSYWRCLCKTGHSGNPYVSCGETPSRTATVEGDPHFKTFDSRKIYRDFMGTCPVTFVRNCEKIPHIPDFKVVVRPSLDCDPGGVKHYACIRNIYFEVFGRTLMFTTEKTDNTIVVDGAIEDVPYTAIPGLRVELSTGPTYIVETNFSVKFTFNTHNDYLSAWANMYVPLSDSLKGKLCGMGGPMTGIDSDDMVLPDGTTTTDPIFWGDSWAYENLHNPKYDSTGCLPGSAIVQDPDVVKHQAWAAQSTACDYLNDPNGIFKDCFTVVDNGITGMAYYSCIFDIGATMYGHPPAEVREAVCNNHLVKYAEKCATALVQEGIKNWEWRAAAGCPVPSCPPNSYFDNMAPACDNTCEHPHAGDTCESPEVQERCYCERGYVLSMGECIQQSQCPGYHDGITYIALKNKTNMPCTSNCMFLHGNDTETNKGLFCKQIYCAEHGSCVAVNGARDCYCDPGYEGDGRFECRKPQQDCVDLKTYHNVSASGVSPVNLWAYLNLTRKVFCDMETDGGGWTVIQRRIDTTDFNKTWQEYTKGFGSLDGSFWYGLEMLHKMTTRNHTSVLRIELEDCSGGSSYQEYHGFKVGPAASNYVMTYTSTFGTAGDAFASDDPEDNDPKGIAFSTWDNDHDEMTTMNCALMYDSGWWHRACTAANLNGKYYENCGGSTDIKTAVWLPKTQAMGSCPKKITMKIRKAYSSA